MITRLEIPCVCGYLGRMIGTSNYDDEGKQRVKFLCACTSPAPDWKNINRD